MNKRNGPPSAHDVARIAGVSQAAVSRAFTPGASISDTTREKVFVAAKELGYRPNLLARSLIKGRSDIIGVVVGNARNPFFTVALDLMSSRLREAGKHLLVFTGESNATADVHVEDLLKYRVDGLVLMWTTMSPALSEQCRNAGIPVVFFNRRAGTTEGFATVAGANSVGVRKIVNHMLEQGYRSFGFIAGLEDSSTNKEREEAFVGELADHGFPAPARVVGHFRRAEGMEAARQLLSLKDRPDAIFCASDIMALGALEVARHEFGLDVGPEVGIAGFDDVEQSAWPSFELTTYSQPVDAMMDKVTDLLLDSAQYEERPHIIVEGELKIRASTRRS
jgi:DNA-binding LacI/PurR family transcriptional regulator